MVQLVTACHLVMVSGQCVVVLYEIAGALEHWTNCGAMRVGSWTGGGLAGPTSGAVPQWVL